MDMNTVFDLDVRTHCPNAEVVYDLFHVIARFGREMADRVQGDQVQSCYSVCGQCPQDAPRKSRGIGKNCLKSMCS